MELLVKIARELRTVHRFGGYIHLKAIPGASARLLYEAGLYADRSSVNIEVPSDRSLQYLAPEKNFASVYAPMNFFAERKLEYKASVSRYTPSFLPAGQSTQMIVGASGESDYQILSLSSGFYNQQKLKRVYYSGYVPINADKRLPVLTTKPPLVREHRLYQADWLLRFYGFRAGELLDEAHPSFHPLVDPKCSWALDHPEFFPVEVNRADYEALLRVPGVGVKSARRILRARRAGSLGFEDLKKLGVVLKRAQFFLTCRGRAPEGLSMRRETVMRALISADTARAMALPEAEQLSLFDRD
jgi:putative DNA modification/repair radical SAM protein